MSNRIDDVLEQEQNMESQLLTLQRMSVHNSASGAHKSNLH